MYQSSAGQNCDTFHHSGLGRLSTISSVLQRCVFATCVCVVLCTGCGRSRPPRPRAADGVEALSKIVDSKPEPGEIKGLYNIRRAEAVTALGELGGPAIPALLRAAMDSDVQVSLAAVAVLDENAPFSREAIPDLIDALRTSNSIFVFTALDKTLEAMGDGAKEFVPLLSNVVKDKSIEYDIRRFVALRLLKIDQEAATKAGVKPQPGFAGGEPLPEIIDLSPSPEKGP